MRDVYSKQLADRSIAGRGKLAQELLVQASRVVSNPSEHFVVAIGAIEAAKEAGHLQVCMRAADAMAQSFDVDALAIKVDAILTANLSAAAGSTVASQNVQTCLDLVEELVVLEDYAAAVRLCNVLQPLAANLPEIRPLVQQRTRQVTALRVTRDRVSQSLETLKTNAEDPAANFVVGTYYCFDRGQWAVGTLYLVKAGRPELKTAALAELANSTTEAAIVVAGDAWWSASDKESVGPHQTAMRQRSANWYQRALEIGELAGLSKVRLEKRIEAVAASAKAATGKPADAARKVATPASSFNPIGVWIKEDTGTALTFAKDGSWTAVTINRRGTWKTDGQKFFVQYPDGHFLTLLVASENLMKEDPDHPIAATDWQLRRAVEKR